jgi:hypothetical protein
VLVDLVEHAIKRPGGTSGTILAPLTEPTAVLEDWTPAERAQALWRLIDEGIHDRALQAAFRLPDADIRESWGSSLTERFKQLKALKAVFGEPTSTQPMEIAWKKGVSRLATYLEQRFGELQTSADWDRYSPKVREQRDRQGAHPGEWQAYFDALDAAETIFRQPSKGAQPVFVNLFITTVFMKKRAVYRRITERLITAQADGVEYYTARGFAGKPPRLTYVPVCALWGCRAELVEPSHAGRPAVTRLWFPVPLRAGDQAHFASEVIDENIAEERHWIDVDIDHHGIARGRLLYGDRLPVSGLTIRVRFDEGYLPEAVWWYAELNESERYDRPPSGDRHLLTIIGNNVQHTFTDQACQPRESYGLAFRARI